MILDSRETTVAYRCPHCGQTTVSVVGVFALSGDLIRLKCGCKKSELQISYTSDRKIRITTPCLVCQKPHTFVLGAGTFFADRVLTYSCPMTGLELCFIGKKDEVLAAASEADRHLLELMDEAGLENLDEIKSPESEDDREDIYFITDGHSVSVHHGRGRQSDRAYFLQDLRRGRGLSHRIGGRSQPLPHHGRTESAITK